MSAQPIPHLVVNDGEAAIDFYTRAFGATCEVKHKAEDGKRVMYGQLKIGAGMLYLNDDFPEFGDASAKKREHSNEADQGPAAA